MVRSAMIDVLRQDYVRTARAKGLARARASCSATRCPTRILPIVAMIGIDIGQFMGGVVVVESRLSAGPASASSPGRRSSGSTCRSSWASRWSRRSPSCSAICSPTSSRRSSIRASAANDASKPTEGVKPMNKIRRRSTDGRDRRLGADARHAVGPRRRRRATGRRRSSSPTRTTSRRSTRPSATTGRTGR